MSGDPSTEDNPASSPPQRILHRAIKSAFSLDQSFFTILHTRLESERHRANEQHSSLLKWLKDSIQPPDGYSVTLKADEILHAPEAVPSVEHLSALVETAFWASLEREEGCALHFKVSFVKPAAGGDRLITFDQPRPYDVRELTKLAPAVGATEGALLVAPFEREELKIWGLKGYDRAPLGVKVIDPGSVVIKFKETNVAAVSRSEAVHIRDPLLTRSSVIWSRFGSGGEGEGYDQWKDPRINAILETIKRMRSLGHGGALIIVPSTSRWQSSVKTPITYSGPNPYSPFRDSILNLKGLIGKPNHSWADEMYWWTGVKEASQTLAHLTTVDGATLITYDLDIIGFGVKLQPTPDSAEPRRIYSVDPLDHENWITRVKIENLGNTRHQSAARFVADQQDAVAFVVSQDGDVSAFVNWQSPSEGAPSLYAHRRLELTLF